MGTEIIAKGVFAESFATEYAPVVGRGLQAIHFLNSSITKAAHNYARGGVDAQIAGTPAEAANRIGFKSLSNYLQSSVPESEEMTIFAVIRSGDTLEDAAHSPVVCGSRQNNIGGAQMFFQPAAGNFQFLADFWTDAAHTSALPRNVSLINVTEIDLSNWSLLVAQARVDRVSIANMTTGASRESSIQSFGRRVPDSTFRIGSAWPTTTAYAGSVEMAFIQMHSAALSPTEISETATDIRRYLATLPTPITV